MAFDEVVSILRSRAAELGLLRARLKINMESRAVFVDGMAHPAVIATEPLEPVDCVLSLTSIQALDFLNRKISGCDLLSGQQVVIAGPVMAEKNAMSVAVRLSVILYHSPTLPSL